MKRAAIYARFSTDLQSERSIDDQIAFCRDIAAREGFAIVATFEDRAASGASTVNRAGFLAMMRAAERRDFDAIIVEDIDRVARDQGDYHAARKRLDFLGITLHAASGVVGRLDGSLRALMGEMYLENLALHVRRGLAGVVREGRHAGGRAYGYRAVPGEPGMLTVEPAEAAIVKEIFARYVAGDRPRAIAGDLNRRNVLPPRGKRWNASTINGNATRGSGMILNEIYAGRIVWNKVRMVKDPASGKRVSRPNPVDQWQSCDAPHLRIVDQETWDKAQAIKSERGGQHRNASRKPPRLLSGLLKCGACGAGMTSTGNDRKGVRLQCSAFRESGTCDNKRMVYRDDIEAAVLDGLRSHLIEPKFFDHFVRTYNAERERLAKTLANSKPKLERRAGEIKRELQRAIDAIVKAGADPVSLAPTIKALEAEKREVASQLAEIEASAPVVTLHPASLATYRADLDRLSALIASGADGACDKLIEIARRLIERVIVHAKTGERGFEVEIRGSLTELTTLRDAFAVRSGQWGMNGSGGGI
ncbi:recombinase family protein [Pseudorhodoplanes sp.]|uniref:recombinase family protein n=1 Tax=Pseudorhodoplanes sp. TaxID=1934341 RepID=UPI00391CAA16